MRGSLSDEGLSMQGMREADCRAELSRRLRRISGMAGGGSPAEGSAEGVERGRRAEEGTSGKELPEGEDAQTDRAEVGE